MRRLGSGERADVYLAHPERDESAVPAAVLKIYRPGHGSEAAIVEAEALSRAWGDHVVELLDLATTSDGQAALVLGRLSAVSLTRLLHDRESVRLGEAITMLAPVLATMGRLHEAGVMHGNLRGEAVLFDASGAPVVACFGRASLVSQGLSAAARQHEPGMIADRATALALVRQVMQRVPHDAADRVIATAQAAASEAAHEWSELVVAALFAAGESEPILFDARLPSAHTVPSRLLAPQPTKPGIAMLSTEGRATRRSGRVDNMLLRATLDRVHAALQQCRAALRRSRAGLGAVRTRVWAIAGTAVAGLVVAILTVPAGGSDAAPEPMDSVVASGSSVAESAPVMGDDPQAALVALLDVRQECMKQLSILCLDGVDQSGSAALADDLDLIAGLKSGTVSVEQWNLATVSITERLGGSALLTVQDPDETEPASFLLVKGEAGWRIRDYLWR